MHAPLQLRDIGKVGVIGQLGGRPDEAAKQVPPASHVAAKGRVLGPEVARQRGKIFLADQLHQHRVGGSQRALRQRLAVRAVGLQAALRAPRLRSIPGRQPACQAGATGRAQHQLQQGLLLLLEAVVPHAATALSARACSARALAASSSNTCSGGMSVSHSTRVARPPGALPKRASACR